MNFPIKYFVRKTKSKKRWVAWPKGKKSLGVVFDTWDLAIKWATLQAFCGLVMQEKL